MGITLKNKSHSFNTIIEPIAVELGYELVGCTLIRQGQYSTLRVYIDGPNGITLDDCTLMSRQVSAVLDVEDIIKGNYNLEVSSPGIDRPLFSKAHYQRFIGEKISMRLHSLIQGRRKLAGILQAINEQDEIMLMVDGKEFIISLEDIEQANLIPKF